MYMHISFYMTVCRADHGIKGTKTYVYGMRFYSFTTTINIAIISKACKLDISDTAHTGLIGCPFSLRFFDETTQNIVKNKHVVTKTRYQPV